MKESGNSNKAWEKFQAIEEQFVAALNELEDEYYRIDESDPIYNAIYLSLKEYGRFDEKNEAVESKLMEEYGIAMEAQAKLQWVLHKMKVELARRFDAEYTGDLYQVLHKHAMI